MTKKKEPEWEADPLHDAGVVLFDHALDSAGLEPREESESVETYIDRDEWGPQTKAHLATALEAARSLNRAQVVNSVTSARQHHADPNPGDTPTLKK